MATTQGCHNLQAGTFISQDEMGPGCHAKVHRHPAPLPPFRFLDLPGELQNEVVQYFIVSNPPIVIHAPRFNRHPSPPPRPRSHPHFDRPVLPTPPLSRSTPQYRDRRVGHSRLALMLTCRKLYREHWRTYYGDNMFVFTLDVFRAFLRDIPSKCLTHMRRIAFRMPHRFHHEDIWRFLSGMKGLEELELWMSKSVITDETVRNCATRGIRECKEVKTFRMKRFNDEDIERDIEESDEALENEIQSYLRSRSSIQRTRWNGCPIGIDVSDENLSNM